MITLLPDECRVFGVLVEKAQTTPQQYPLTLNGLTVGCNQKNNRFPVVEWDDDRVYDALDGLRAKKLVNEVNLTGSRVPKFKHNAREVLGVDTSQLILLTELLLRGPQSAGDLRSRASRMHPLESLEIVQDVLEALIKRDPPMVKELPPQPGTRAKRYVQLLCTDLHKLDAVSPGEADAEPHCSAMSAPSASADVLHRLSALESHVQQLEEALNRLAARLGEQL